MLQESKYLQVLCLAILLTACAGEGPGEDGLDTEPSAAEEAGDNPETDTTDTDTEVEDDSGTEANDAGTQTDDEGTNDAGTQTDDEGTNDAGTQTDDEGTNDDASDETEDEPGTTDDTESSDDPEHDLNGKWEGSYTCSQGFTRLTLQVTHNFESHGLDAVFAFYADDSNPDVPTGRYSMVGTYNHDSGNVDLNEAEWIEQPGGYVMVSLDGFINDEGTSITGTVDNSGCTEFTVVRGN